MKNKNQKGLKRIKKEVKKYKIVTNKGIKDLKI